MPQISRRASALILIFSLGLGGCVGPLVVQETGRTVGRHHAEVLGGYGQAGYVAKGTFGLTDNWDIGIQWETLSLGLRTKYSILNKPDGGISLAVAAGAGTSSYGPSHYYGDVIISWLKHQLEPYFAVRYAKVHSDVNRIAGRYTGDVRYSIRTPDFEYGQFLLGSRVWLGDSILFAAEVSAPVSMSDNLFMSQALLFGASIGYRF